MSDRIEVFVAETLRMAVPYVACALGAVATERAGLINIALEGTLVISGLTGAAVAIAVGSAWAGLVAAFVSGALFCLAHALLVTRAKVDAIVSGLALNIMAFGGSRVALRLLYDSASNSPHVPGFGAAAESPLLRVVLDPAFLLVLLAVPLLTWLLGRTRFGLRLRASGDGPVAAEAAGIVVSRVQLAASTLCGGLAALGGAHLVFDHHHFDAGMSGGRGFIALAAVLLGRHIPAGAALACVGFAALEATQIAVQDLARVPPELVQLLPYLATLVLLGSVAKGRRWGQS